MNTVGCAPEQNLLVVHLPRDPALLFFFSICPNSLPALLATAIIPASATTDRHITAHTSYSDGTLVAAMALLGRAQQPLAHTCSSQHRPLSVCTSLAHRAHRDPQPAFLCAQLRPEGVSGSERGALCVPRAATLGALQVPRFQATVIKSGLQGPQRGTEMPNADRGSCAQRQRLRSSWSSSQSQKLRAMSSCLAQSPCPTASCS